MLLPRRMPMRGYASFLFMLVDIMQMCCYLLVHGRERAVAKALGTALEADGHTLMVEELVSRKKQLLPLLPRIQASLSEKLGQRNCNWERTPNRSPGVASMRRRNHYGRCITYRTESHRDLEQADREHSEREPCYTHGLRTRWRG